MTNQEQADIPDVSMGSLTGVKAIQFKRKATTEARKLMRDGFEIMKFEKKGAKDSLLKPGAELLRDVFGFRVETAEDIKREVDKEGITQIHVYSRALVYLPESDKPYATGSGYASSMEDKHRNRYQFNVVGDLPKAYWDNGRKLAPLGFKDPAMRAKKVDGAWKVVMSSKGVNQNPENEANTVVKMARKRSYVDGIISAASASWLFTQDVEDIIANEQNNTSQSEVDKFMGPDANKGVPRGNQPPPQSNEPPPPPPPPESPPQEPPKRDAPPPATLGPFNVFVKKIKTVHREGKPPHWELTFNAVDPEMRIPWILTDSEAWMKALEAALANNTEIQITYEAREKGGRTACILTHAEEIQ